MGNSEFRKKNMGLNGCAEHGCIDKESCIIDQGIILNLT